MNEFKKGDFIRFRDGRLGVVAGIRGNQLEIRFNDMSGLVYSPDHFNWRVEKINGRFVPLDLSDDMVRKNLRRVWCQLKYNIPEDILVEAPCCSFYKWSSGEWGAMFEVGDYNTGVYDAEELMKIATIDGLPVAAVEGIKEAENE